MTTVTDPDRAPLEWQEPTAKYTVVDGLGSQSNTHPLVHHLPAELLEVIFIQCAYDHYVPLNVKKVASWVNVSYVCRHWRSVALTCPTLWTYHFLVSLRWTEELLARSKQAPLKICFPFVMKIDRWLSRVVERLMEHWERIQELHLKFMDIHAERLLKKLSSPAPCLQTLKIERDCRSYRWPSVLFGGNTPVLRALELSQCSAPWHSLQLSGLTTLRLDRVSTQVENGIAGFLAMLSRMQDLRHLYIDKPCSFPGTADFLSSPEFETFQKISLPHLSCVLIAAPLSMLVAILSCINIPLGAKLRLQCISDSDFSLGDHHSILSPFLAQRFRALEDQAHVSPTVRSLTISFSGAVTLTFFPVSHVPDAWRFSVHSKLRVMFWGWDPKCLDSIDIVNDVCGCMPLADVERFHVLDPPSSSDFWETMLGRLPNIRYLKLSGGSMPNLNSVLSSARKHVTNRSLTGDEDGDADEVVAPYLEELELSKINFHQDDEARMPMTSLLRRQLLDALLTRHNASQGRLIMAKCIVGTSTELDTVRSWDDLNDWVVGEGNSEEGGT